jgi:hypothetical protein
MSQLVARTGADAPPPVPDASGAGRRIGEPVPRIPVETATGIVSTFPCASVMVSSAVPPERAVTVICALPGPEFTSDAVAISGREFVIVKAPVYPGSTTEIVFVALASPRRITRFVSLAASLLVAAFDDGAGDREPIGENRRRRAAAGALAVLDVTWTVVVFVSESVNVSAQVPPEPLSVTVH